MGGGLLPQPPSLFQRQKCLLGQEGKLPFFLIRENMHTRASSTQEEESHTKTLWGLESEENIASHTSNLPACKAWSGCKVCKWGRVAPSNPFAFFKDKLSAHKKPMLNRTSSPIDLSAAVPQASTQERDCHTKTLQGLSPKGFWVNSNNLRSRLGSTGYNWSK